MRTYNKVVMWRGLLASAILLVSSRLASAQGSMAVEFYHLDAQGNVLALTDSNGNLVESHDYDVYGQEVNPQAGTQPKRFTGKERDTETGWDYFGARYYGSKIGRFTTTDPVYTWQENILDPQRWNRYAHGRNNPLRYVDPDGRAPWDTVSGWFNAVSSNVFLGGGRMEAYHPDYATGQAAGDRFSLALGLLETGVGFGGGAVLEIPSLGTVTIPAAAIVTHGLGVSATAGIYLSKSQTGPKASDAPGTSGSGQATDEYGNKLGPSGKPMVHETESTTREGARNKALNEGSGAVEHSNPKRGQPHFHPADAQGEKKPNSTHHNYPE